MNVSICSFLTAIVCCSVFVCFALLLKSQKTLTNSLSMLAVAMALCFVRLLVMIEIPAAMIIRSYNVLPAILRFMRLELYTVFGKTITVFNVIIASWIFISSVLMLRFFYRVFKIKKNMLNSICVHNPRAEQILADIVSQTKPRQKYHLIISNAIETPRLLGFFTPIICIPELVLSDEDYHNILRHEWTHYMLKHAWIKVFVQLIWFVFWWNPLIYFLKKDIDHILEVNCDTYLTADMCEAERCDYLQTTTNVMTQLNNRKLLLSANALGYVSTRRKKKITQRFEIVLNYTKPKNKIRKWILVSLMIVVYLLSYGFVIQPSGPPPVGFTISSDNAYIYVNEGGVYSLYVGGEYKFDITIDSIESEPFSSLPIIFD